MSLVIGKLLGLGWVLSVKKSVLEPAQNLLYLGVILDNIRAKVFLPPAESLSLRNRMSKLRNHKSPSICLSGFFRIGFYPWKFLSFGLFISCCFTGWVNCEGFQSNYAIGQCNGGGIYQPSGWHQESGGPDGSGMYFGLSRASCSDSVSSTFSSCGELAGEIASSWFQGKGLIIPRCSVQFVSNGSHQMWVF